MITSRQPESWQELQEAVGAVLRECGFSVEVEKRLDTVRGSAEIDVYSEETVSGRKYVILCECKHWRNRVPQNVIHSFRSIVVDSGANLGYIISSAGFQSGSFRAADLTNVQLMTWPEFQQEFEKTWIERHLLPFVAGHFEQLLEFTDELLPTKATRLPEDRLKEFIALKRKYDVFGQVLMHLFTPYPYIGNSRAYPPLPLQSYLGEGAADAGVPAAILDALGYKEVLESALVYGDQATREFEDVLKAR